MKCPNDKKFPLRVISDIDYFHLFLLIEIMKEGEGRQRGREDREREAFSINITSKEEKELLIFEKNSVALL